MSDPCPQLTERILEKDELERYGESLERNFFGMRLDKRQGPLSERSEAPFPTTTRETFGLVAYYNILYIYIIMPIRRFRRKPRRKKSNRYAPRPVRLLVKKQPQSSQSRVLNFKRTFVNDVVLNASSPPSGWTSLAASGENAIALAYVLSLSQIPNYQNFTSLFDSYRIKGVRIQGWYSATVSANTSNSQSLLYTCRDNIGQSQAADMTEEYFLQRPRSKKRVLINSVGKPSFDMFVPLSNLSTIYSGAVQSDYAMAKPRFISTNEPATPYYGLNLRLQRIDGNNWTHGTANQYPTLKLYTTVYFQMRGINS